MKTIILLILISVMVQAQTTYDVGQTNANISLALSRALAQPDSNTVYRNAISLKFNITDTTVFVSDALLNALLAYKLNISDSSIYLTPSDAGNAYSPLAHSHTEFLDTVKVSGWGVMDTVTTGDYIGIKMENNFTITEIAAYTNTGTVTFNIEERGETTPNTAGTDVMTSDLVADNNQQETGIFSNATIARDSWLVLTVTSISGDPTIFGITVRGVKTN